jgi:hypothetical protein
MAAPAAAWAELAPAIRGCGPTRYGRAEGKGLEQGTTWSKVEDDLDPSASNWRRRRPYPARGQAGAPARQGRVQGHECRGQAWPVSMVRRVEARFRVYRRGTGSDTRPGSLLLAWDLSTASPPIPSSSRSAGGRGH